MQKHDTDSDGNTLRLIETIYRTALDPGDYDQFMAQWHDWISVRMDVDSNVVAPEAVMTSPEIAAHFELALRLLERLGETPAEAPRKGPQMLVNSLGQVLWQNAEADRLFDTSLDRSLDEFDLSGAHRAELDHFLTNLKNPSAEAPHVVQITPGKSTRSVAFRVEPMREGEGDPLALLSALTPAWPRAMDQLLAETHKLSASEVAICGKLVEGLSPASIAKRRNTSVATVRTQIKRILSKTQMAAQPELVAHLHTLMRLAETMQPADPRPALPAPLSGRHYDLIVNGRRVALEEHGPKDGYPTVFVHGMLDGSGITRSIHQGLRDRNLRLICPHRPAFGRSDPTPDHASAAMALFAEDLAEIQRQLCIEKPVLIGHMAGALYTFAACRTVNARGIVNVSGGVPITSPRQFETMTRRQRLVAYTALYTPSILPFVINGGVRQIKNGGIETFMRSLYEQVPVDRAVLDNDEIRSVVLSGYEFTVAQGHQAFATDSHHVVRDWTPIFENTSPVPVTLVHGTHDPVVGITSVRKFAEKYHDRVALIEASDAGQLVFYQHPDIVLNAAAAMI